MMRIARLLVVVIVPLLLVGTLSSLLTYPAQATPSSVCEPDGQLPSGAYYRICMPSGEWNGNLAIYAHGYVAFNKPITIPEDQLQLPGGSSLPELINSLGFAFATTSYRMNGLAIKTGVDDLVDVVNVFSATHSVPTYTLVTGVSEGGLITALAIEQRPDVFDGGLATCGPIGDFSQQINYFGDFRVLFDYFFPGVIPGSPDQHSAVAHQRLAALLYGDDSAADLCPDQCRYAGPVVERESRALHQRPHHDGRYLRLRRAFLQCHGDERCGREIGRPAVR